MKGMVSIVEIMLKARDREALIDKVVDRTMEIAIMDHKLKRQARR